MSSMIGPGGSPMIRPDPTPTGEVAGDAASSPSGVSSSSPATPLPPPATSPSRPELVRDVVYIGVGSATAYSLAAMNHEAQLGKPDEAQPFLGKVTVIGVKDAWDPTVRGPGYINHQTQIIAHWGDHAPSYNPSYADRAEFSEGNRGQIDQARRMGAEALATDVKSVTRGEGGVFTVTLGNDDVVTAKKVVVAMGAGPHTTVGGTGTKTVEENKLSNNLVALPVDSPLRARVMDLDSFMVDSARDPEKYRGKLIAVHGPNAGIDAAEQARLLGGELLWLTRSSAPPILEGNHLVFAPEDARNIVKHTALTVSASDTGGLKLSTTSGATTTDRPVDFYVYALGQDPGKTGSVGDVLRGLMTDLEPRYDIDQIYSDQPYKTALGLQTKGSTHDTGVSVIGASASSIAPQVADNYVESARGRLEVGMTALYSAEDTAAILALADAGKPAEASALISEKTPVIPPDAEGATKIAAAHRAIKSLVEDYCGAKAHRALSPTTNVTSLLTAAVTSEVASVVQPAQLAAVKGTVAALNAFIPGYVKGGEANFTTDNRTMLRVFIAQEFPNINDEQATRFINELIALRSATGEQTTAARAQEIVGDVLPMGVLSDDALAAQFMSRGATEDAALAAAQHLNGTAPRASGAAAPTSGEARALAEASLSEGLSPIVPAWGTPEEVRDKYLERLGELNRQEAPSGSLLKLWG